MAMSDNLISSTSASEKKKKTTDGIPPTDVVLPNAKLSQWIHELRLPVHLSSSELKEEAKKQLLIEVEKDEMLHFYQSLCDEFSWPKDEGLIQRLTIENNAEAASLDAALEDAQENLGDVEVKDCLLSKAHFLCRIGDIDSAVKAYELARQKTVGSGSRLDILLTLVRIGLLFGLHDLTSKTLAAAKIDCEKGGDWERRNKLKIYSAIFLAQQRKFAEAAELLLGCIAIFTASELISFEGFIFTTVVLSMVSLERPALKSKVMTSPEAAQILEEDPLLKTFLESYFHCRYHNFMESLVGISNRIQRDLYLHKHARYFVRAIRMKAYRQFLEPFSSVTISSMAEAFGVSTQFIETDVADYIANAKLNCKIDRVNGVIVYTRTTSTNKLYLKAIKQGDLLLSKIQKLSKIIDM